MPEAADNLYARTFALMRDELPGEPPEIIRHYAVVALNHGQDAKPEHVHNAWAAWRLSTRLDHPDLVPFGGLSEEVQKIGRPYPEAILRVAREVG